MKKINIFIITLILIITLGVTKLTPNAIITVGNNAYDNIKYVMHYKHGVIDYGSGNIYYDEYYSFNQDLNDFNIKSWNPSTSAISMIFLNKSLGLGIETIPSGVSLPLLQVQTGTSGKLTSIISGNKGTSGGKIDLNYIQGSISGSLDISSDYLSDYFAGVIITYLIDIDDNLNITSSSLVISIIQYINNDWYISSYPLQYTGSIYQAIGVDYLYSLYNSALKEYSNYTNLYILNYERLSGGDLYDTTTGAPVSDVKVWNENGVELLNYLSDTVGLSFKGYTQADLSQNYYNAGLSDGQLIGYENGYNKGLEEGSNVTTNWIATISQGVGHVLALEIAPNLPLGLLVAIPLVLGMLGLILHFWRKD